MVYSATNLDKKNETITEMAEKRLFALILLPRK